MVPVGQKGVITSGEQNGWSIFVQDDLDNTGGYLILTSPDNFVASGFDGWVEAAYLDDYFASAGWEITWLPINTVDPIDLQPLPLLTRRPESPSNHAGVKE